MRHRVEEEDNFIFGQEDDDDEEDLSDYTDQDWGDEFWDEERAASTIDIQQHVMELIQIDLHKIPVPASGAGKGN